MYEYKAKLVKVVDGDTVDVDIDLGFGVWLKNERVRIMGIDTPESRTRDKVEKIFGLAAKARVQELIEKHQPLQLYLEDKFISQFINRHQIVTNVTKEMRLFVQQMMNVELIHLVN